MSGLGREERKKNSWSNDNDFFPRYATSVTVTKLSHFIIIPPFQKVDTNPEFYFFKVHSSALHHCTGIELFFITEYRHQPPPKVSCHLPDLGRREAMQEEWVPMCKEKVNRMFWKC